MGLDPKNHAAKLNRGIAYWNKKEYARALLDYNALIQANPADAEAYYNRGLVYMDQNKNNDALADFEKYVSMDVTSKDYLADGYLNKGIVRYRKGDLTGSVSDLTKAISLRPGPKSYRARAATYRKMGKPSLAEADERQALGADMISPPR